MHVSACGTSLKHSLHKTGGTGTNVADAVFNEYREPDVANDNNEEQREHNPSIPFALTRNLFVAWIGSVSKFFDDAADKVIAVSHFRNPPSTNNGGILFPVSELRPAKLDVLPDVVRRFTSDLKNKNFKSIISLSRVTIGYLPQAWYNQINAAISCSLLFT